ncbi:MAG: hypothetical protein GY725_05700 [bacterium]|nr:hypothetical protein [bacterium]
MPRVQEMLAAAAVADDTQRKQLLIDAQREMQAILRRLMVERELVRARRQRAELIARIREIIVSQQSAHRRTSELSGSDEQAILAALDQQNTTGILFEQFLDTIAAVSAWSGELGATAAEASRVLLASGLTGKLTAVAGQLEQTRFREAAAGQQEILADLARIEIAIHKLLDPAWIGKDIARAIKEMLEEQEALRKQSQDFAGADPFGLLEEQTLLQEKLSRLVEKVTVVNERAAMLAARAERSAEEARTAIFRDEMPAAVDSQGRVIGALVELQSEMIHHDGRTSRPLSATEYRRLAEHLTKARDVLVAAREKLPPPSDNATRAKAALKEAAKIVGSLELEEATPRVIVRRIETARAYLDDLATGKMAVDAESLRLANRLVRFAIGETVQGIADAGRNSDAMKVAELNRAAESVSRAVGAVRDDRLSVLTNDSRLSLRESSATPDAVPDAAPSDTFAERNATKRSEMLGRVKAIAEKVAAGVPDLAAAAVPSLEKAAQQAGRLHAQVPDMEAEDWRGLAEPLEDLAATLRSASVELRSEMVWTAGELEERVVAELTKLEATAVKLDEFADATSPPPQDALREFGNRTLEQYAAVGAALHAAADVDSRLSLRESSATPDAAPGAEAAPSATFAERKATMTQRQLERACVLADIRRQELEELLETIRELVQGVERQQQAAEQLVDARDVFEAEVAPPPDSESSEPQDGDPQDGNQQESDPVDPSELASAFEDFMNSLVDIGESAADLTDQQEVANKPIAEAAQIASQLAPTPSSQEGGDPMDGNTDPMDGDMEPTDGDMQPLPGDMEPMDGDMQPLPGDMEPMGGDIVPQDALGSAELLSGPHASALAAQMLGLGGPIPMQGFGPGQGRGMPMEGPATDPMTDDPQDQGGLSGHDVRTAAARQRGRKPWTASLPAAVRESIRSTGRRELPRYYENRLNAYFQALTPK